MFSSAQQARSSESSLRDRTGTIEYYAATTRAPRLQISMGFPMRARTGTIEYDAAATRAPRPGISRGHPFRTALAPKSTMLLLREHTMNLKGGWVSTLCVQVKSFTIPVSMYLDMMYICGKPFTRCVPERLAKQRLCQMELLLYNIFNYFDVPLT